MKSPRGYPKEVLTGEELKTMIVLVAALDDKTYALPATRAVIARCKAMADRGTAYLTVDFT